MEVHEYYQQQHARFREMQRDFAERVVQYQQWQQSYLQHLHHHILRHRLIAESEPSPLQITMPTSVASESVVGAGAVSDVTDQQWEAVAPLLMRRTGQERIISDSRTTLNGILYHLHTNCTWRAIPKRYGTYVTCWRWQLRWENTGVLPHIQHILRREGYTLDS